ncbi:MAG TPA: IPT/TIG domain-containing protein, partial [Bryobacteraceae bacterium]
SWPLAAQAPTPDNTGNGMLSGSYLFRQVIYVVSGSPDSQGIVGDISEPIAIYGTITFDGNGNYVIGGGTDGGLVADSGFGAPTPLSCYLADTTCTSGSPVSGTYSISASGLGSISSPLASLVSGDAINGLVGANGVFIGSTTETSYAYGDLFVATPLGTSQPTNATFNGTYTVTGFVPGNSPASSADMFFQMSADGNGNLGTVNVTGYYGAGGTSTISQSNSNMTYFFSGAAAVVTFPTSATANFFSGKEYLYFSPDGSFFVGGSPTTGATNTTGYDMIIGVRNGSGTQNLQGNYYQAGIDQNISEAASGYVDFDSYYGAFIAQSNGNILAHQRLNDQIFYVSSYDFTFSDSFTPGVSSYIDNGVDSVYPAQYAVGANGAVRIGEGVGPFLGISVALQAPTFTPTQPVYIDPTGVVSSASFSPFTAGISNGEFITIFGTNLAPSTAVASTIPFPKTLAGVQVTINQQAAPIYYVDSGQIIVITPYVNPYALATIQVNNNGVLSNPVTMRVAPTTPGLFANPPGGAYAAVYDYTAGQILTPLTPAQPGDVLEVYGTGFGTVYPPIPDGSAPPLDGPVSSTTNTITADVDGVNATVSMAVLVPTLVSLYQINVTIPTTTTAGDHFLDILGSDPDTQAVESYSQQVMISVGSGALAETPPAASARGRRARKESARKRPAPCFSGAKSACTMKK